MHQLFLYFWFLTHPTLGAICLAIRWTSVVLHARSNRFSPVRRESRQNSSRKKEGLLRMKSVLNSALISVYRKINLHRSGEKSFKNLLGKTAKSKISLIGCTSFLIRLIILITEESSSFNICVIRCSKRYQSRL